MKVIFLDIDGVLNNPGCYAIASGNRTPVDPNCVAALNHITDSTGAKLVISSTWRFGGIEFCTSKLREWGVTAEVVGITSTDHQDRRGYEIGGWLTGLCGQEVESFVILDDDDDMASLISRLVQTTGHVGLTMRDAERAIHLLEATL